MTGAQQITTVVVLAIVALVGLAVLGPIVGVVTTTDAGTAPGTVYLEPAPSDATTIEGLKRDDPVRATTGTAVELEGQGAYVDDPTNDSVFERGSWTMAMVIDANESVVDAADTRTLYAHENESVLLLYERGNITLRVENSTGATAYAEADGSLSETTVSAAYNASADEIALYVNGTQRDTAAFTTATEPRDPAAAWIGTLDEIRAWNASLSSSDHAAYDSEPVTPLPDNAALRLMVNDRQPAVAYYTPGDAQFVGAHSFVDGVSGPDLTRGDDYTIDDNDISTVAGGAVEGAPVLIVTVAEGDLNPTVAAVVGGVSGALELLPVVMLAILSTVIISIVGRLRQGV